MATLAKGNDKRELFKTVVPAPFHLLPFDVAQPKLPLVSLILPLLNERAGLGRLFVALRTATKGVPVDFELVVAEDGSTDGSKEAVITGFRDFSRWQLIALSHDFGQQAVYRAGTRTGATCPLDRLGRGTPSLQALYQ